MKQAQSIYIHIPFCRTHCPYCDFAVYLDHKGRFFEQYTQALCEEIKAAKQSGQQIETIYLGGGTPSLLPVEYLEGIFQVLNQSFNISNNAEITIEINPGTIDKEKLQAYKSLNINRLSIGVQSFEGDLLKKIARLHTLQDIYQTFNVAREAGFQNISLDLIYGLPGQTLEHLQNSLSEAIKLSVEHISIYALQIEQGTPFQKIYGNSNHPSLPNEDSLGDMYQTILETLQRSDYLAYEISNFAKSGYQSRHNINYWALGEYYGFGVGAHGFIDQERYYHSKDLQEYIKNPQEVIIDQFNQRTEQIMLALRTTEGLDLSTPGLDLPSKAIKKYQDLNLVKIENNRLKLTQKAYSISNYIIAEFI